MKIANFAINKFLKCLFDRVKKLFESDQTRHGVCPMYLELKTKKIAIACLGKKLGFHTEICDYFEQIGIIEF